MASPRSRALLIAASAAIFIAPACNLILGITPGETLPGHGGGGSSSVSSTSSTSGTGGATSSSSSSSSGTGGSAGGPITCLGGGPKADVPQYTKRAPGGGYESGVSVAFGNNHNVFLTGFYSSDNTAFGLDNLPYTISNGADVFIVRYDATGNHDWSRGFGGPGDQEPTAIAVDPNDDVIIGGTFGGSIDFDGKVLTANTAQIEKIDSFIVKLSGQGPLAPVLWAVPITGNDDEIVDAVAVDGDGDVVVSGRSNGAVDFGPLCGVKSVTSARSIFLAKFDKDDGHCLWARLFDGDTRLYNQYTRGYRTAMVVDTSTDDIFVTGGAVSPNFGQGPLIGFGDKDVYVLRASGADGSRKNDKSFYGMAQQDDGLQYATAIALDRCGDVLIAGSFTKQLTFGMTMLTSPGVMGGDDDDIFVAKLEGLTFNPIWAKSFGDAGFQRPLSIGADDHGNVTVTGLLLDNAASTGISFGGEVLPGFGPYDADAGAYKEDVFAFKLDPMGAHVWSKRWGTIGYEEPKGGSSSPSGFTAITGAFTTDGALLDFGGGTQVLAAEYIDGFLVVLGP